MKRSVKRFLLDHVWCDGNGDQFVMNVIKVVIPVTVIVWTIRSLAC